MTLRGNKCWEYLLFTVDFQPLRKKYKCVIIEKLKVRFLEKKRVLVTHVGRA